MAVQNKNLFIAEKLLEFFEEDFSEYPQGSILVSKDHVRFAIGPNAFPEFIDDDLTESFLALTRRGAIHFLNAGEVTNPRNEYIEYFEIEPNKEKLIEFIGCANNKTLGIPLKTKLAVKNALAILRVLAKDTPHIVRLGRNAQIVKTDEVGIKDFSAPGALELLEWIADYSGMIQIEREIVSAVNYEDGRASWVEAEQKLKSVSIRDREKLNTLIENIRTVTADNLYAKPIAALLAKQKEIVWRCKKCNGYLERMNDTPVIAGFLTNFALKKFRICIKCRTRNRFTISKAGVITFPAVKNAHRGR